MTTPTDGDHLPGWLKPVGSLLKLLLNATKDNAAGLVLIAVIFLFGWNAYKQDDRETRAELRERETRLATMEGQQKLTEKIEDGYDRMEARREKFTAAQVQAIAGDISGLKASLDRNTEATNRAVDVFRGLKLAPKKTPSSNPNLPPPKGPKPDPEVDEDFDFMFFDGE